MRWKIKKYYLDELSRQMYPDHSQHWLGAASIAKTLNEINCLTITTL